MECDADSALPQASEILRILVLKNHKRQALLHLLFCPSVADRCHICSEAGSLKTQQHDDAVCSAQCSAITRKWPFAQHSSIILKPLASAQLPSAKLNALTKGLSIVPQHLMPVHLEPGVELNGPWPGPAGGLHSQGPSVFSFKASLLPQAAAASIQMSGMPAHALRA